MREIPIDDEDWQYHRSFKVEELENNADAAASFFDEFGFIIVRDVITKDECEDLIGDMLALLQELDSNVDRNDPTTWDRKLGRFGMPCARNKALFRPLLHRPAGQHMEWLSPKNVHLDLNPFIVDSDEHRDTVMSRLGGLDYNSKDLGDFIAENNDCHSCMGLSLQGLVNLRDLPIGCGGGGTIVVPGSHKPGKWQPLRLEEKQTRPMQYTFDQSMLRQAQCIGLRAGSLLIWNQRTIHGSTPNQRSNMGDLRAAIPIRFFRKAILRHQPKRAKSRASTIQREIEKCNFTEQVTDLGHSVFGLDLLRS